MKKIALVLLAVLFVAMFTIDGAMAASEDRSGGGPDTAATGIFGQKQSREEEQNRIREEENEVAMPNRTREEVQARIRENEMASQQGISAQVRQIIEERKNGTITIPQGAAVSIIARNHSLSAEDAVLAINETVNINITPNGKGKVFLIRPDKDAVNISDEGVEVQTRENLRFEKESLYVSGKKVAIFPSQLREHLRVREVKSVALQAANGEPQYAVNATRKAKVLWLFDADMDVEAIIDAATGEIREEKRPWWSFLAGTD